MTDKMTPEQRHRCMSHIHGKGTKPELKVRQWLWQHGYRYRLNVKSVPGKPDIVMRKYRTAIFVNGCQLAFPDDDHLPAVFLKQLVVLLISLLVATDFVYPKLPFC